MISEVFIQSYNDFPFNEKEILRYAGCRDGADEAVLGLMHECTGEVSSLLACKFNISYRILPVSICEEGLLDFDILKVRSFDLAKCLKDCDGAVIMAATIGHGFDRLIGKYNRVNPAKALFMQAIGAERIETMLDEFCKELPAKIEAITGREDVHIRPRYSPGFGDLTLSVQPQVLDVVNANKRLGISLNEGFLMSPSKSVTAIIGILK